MRFLRHLPSSAFKFAVFTVACLVLLAALAVKVGNISLFSHRHTIYAQMSDVTGLITGDPVDVAGVPVGQVSSIAVQRGHALVGLSVNNTLVLHSGSDVGIRWQNVIGQKVVYLYPEQGGHVLAATRTIPLSHDVSDASVDAFLNSLGPFLSSINPKEANEFVENVSGALQGDTVEIDQLVDNAATVSTTVGNLDSQVGTVIDSLDQVLTAIASRSGDLGTLVTNLQTVAQSLASHNTVLDEVVVNLGQVANDLASLVGKNRGSLDTTITDLQSVTQDVAAHQQDLEQSLSTLGEGLAPYTEISSYGQWFQIQTVYTCLANETTCVFDGTGAPSGSSPLSSALPGSSSSSSSSSVSSILGNVAGGSTATGSDPSGGTG